MGLVGQNNPLQSLEFLCAPVKPPLERSTHLVHVSYHFPAIPADLSLPPSTGALLPIKLSFKRIFLAALISVAHGSQFG